VFSFKPEKIMKTKRFVLYMALTFLPFCLLSQGLTIHPGSEVTVKGGASITINNGDLLIRSTSATNAGSLVLDDNVNTAVTLGGGTPGTAKVQRYLDNDKYHYISSPISNGTINTFLGIYLLKFVETNANSGDTTNWANNWVYLTLPTTTPLNVMQGYAAWNQTGSGTNDFTFSGTLNNGPSGSPVQLSPSPTNSGSSYGKGWNLAGNPYPCAIDWGTGNSPVSGWAKTNIDSSIYFWDGTNAQYAVFNSAGAGTGTNSATKIIPSTQGFFVHVTNGQASGTLSADNRVRLHSSQAFWKNTEEDVTEQLRLKAEGNSYHDELIVRFIPGSQPGFDSQYDGYKMFGGDYVPQLYSVTTDNTDLSINTLPEITQNLSVPVKFFTGINGVNVLTASQMSSFGPAITIFLEDKKLNLMQNLREDPQYVFNYDTTDDPNRFVLHFSDPFSGTGNQQADQRVQIYSFENTICIRSIDSQPFSGTMSLYDPLGREIYQSTLVNKRNEILHFNLSTGYYFVRLVTGDNIYSRKVLLNRR
jgi:hypothetical protein